MVSEIIYSLCETGLNTLFATYDNLCQGYLEKGLMLAIYQR